MLGPRRRFWFGGDTGYCSVFKEIGATYGPFDAAAIPIGAYEPRWFHAPAHLDPTDAVAVHADVRSKASIAVHCCTWSLTDEALDEPPRRLAEAAAAAGLGAHEFVALAHGETTTVLGADSADDVAADEEEVAAGVTPAEASA